eukprot:m.339551 g.339551  ORF g.339551 m.339551 type:complete len:392 (-) comp18863_c0_seq1:115-1290(-)
MTYKEQFLKGGKTRFDWNHPPYKHTLPERFRHSNLSMWTLKSIINNLQPKEAYYFFMDEYAALLYFIQIILRVDTLVLLAVAACSPVFFHYYEYASETLNFNLSWTIVSFAVVFPLSLSLSEAFKRRETALYEMALFKANMINIFMAHRDWDWDFAKDLNSSGRDRVAANHIQDVIQILEELMYHVGALLDLPRARIRHTVSKRIKAQTLRNERDATKRYYEIMSCYARLDIACEELKLHGIPGNEAARIRQYNSLSMGSFFKLLAIKRYRTPVGLRSFARIYIMLTPWMFGPYYEAVARGANLAYAIILSVFTTAAMHGLFVMRLQLEDPFDDQLSPDAVNVMLELQEIISHFGLKAEDWPHEEKNLTEFDKKELRRVASQSHQVVTSNV